MDKIRVVLKSKKGTHYAEGFYEGGKITVVKGSRIYVDNGMIAWRPDDKVSLKEYMKGRS